MAFKFRMRFSYELLRVPLISLSICQTLTVLLLSSLYASLCSAMWPKGLEVLFMSTPAAQVTALCPHTAHYTHYTLGLHTGYNSYVSEERPRLTSDFKINGAGKVVKAIHRWLLIFCIDLANVGQILKLGKNCRLGSLHRVLSHITVFGRSNTALWWSFIHFLFKEDFPKMYLRQVYGHIYMYH